MVYLNKICVGVELPYDTEFFAIDSMSQPPFIAKIEVPHKLPRHLKQYRKISLLSDTVLGANTELRALLEPLGILDPTTFEYGLDARSEQLFIRDNDTANHRVISIGCHIHNFCEGDRRSESFRTAISSSNFVQGVPSWEGSELAVGLKSQYAQPSQLLSTFAALLTLFK